MPETIPLDKPTVAIAVLLLVHVPPGVELVSVAVCPVQTTDGPAIEPMAELMFTVVVLLQPVPTAYVIKDVPLAMPVTIPVVLPIVATEVVADDHVPPDVVEASIVVLPTQVLVVPVMAAGRFITENALVVVQPPGKV